MRILFAILICTCSFLYLEAQPEARWPIQAGFGFSGISYTGDYSDGGSSLSRVYPGANLSLQSSHPRALKLQFNVGFGKFAEQYDTDSPSVPPGVEIPSFIETNFTYGDLRLKYHFFNTKNFQPYISAGAGIMFFSPKDQNGRKLLRRTATRLEGEDFNDIIPELPLNAGIYFHLTKQVWMDLSYTYRYTPTDYLDNVGLAGENNGFDALHSVQIGIAVTLGPKPDIAGPTAQVTSSSLPINGDTLSDLPVEEKTTREGEEMKPIAEKTVEEGKEEMKPEAKAVEKISENTEERKWKEKAEAAIEADDFIYYKIKKGESLESLSEKFHISPDLIQKLNFLPKPQTKGRLYVEVAKYGDS